MYKFYVCKFTNIVFQAPDDGKVFIKPGITHHTDVMKRFDPSVDDGYSKNYADWSIECLFSMSFETKAEAEAMESYWLETKFPPASNQKVWVEEYLSTPTNNYYDNNTGISELRLMSEKQAKWVVYQCYELKKAATKKLPETQLNELLRKSHYDGSY